MNAELSLPADGSVPAATRSLLEGLLTRDPQQRLGAWDEVPLVCVGTRCRCSTPQHARPRPRCACAWP
jgi:hypothetical protein